MVLCRNRAQVRRYVKVLDTIACHDVGPIGTPTAINMERRGLPVVPDLVDIEGWGREEMQAWMPKFKVIEGLTIGGETHARSHISRCTKRSRIFIWWMRK